MKFRFRLPYLAFPKTEKSKRKTIEIKCVQLTGGLVSWVLITDDYYPADGSSDSIIGFAIKILFNHGKLQQLGFDLTIK